MAWPINTEFGLKFVEILKYYANTFGTPDLCVQKDVSITTNIDSSVTSAINEATYQTIFVILAECVRKLYFQTQGTTLISTAMK